MYEDMLAAGHVPNTTTYNALITAHSKAGSFNKVLEAFQQMVQQVGGSSGMLEVDRVGFAGQGPYLQPGSGLAQRSSKVLEAFQQTSWLCSPG